MDLRETRRIWGLLKWIGRCRITALGLSDDDQINEAIGDV
jgi:hypothetical protein